MPPTIYTPTHITHAGLTSPQQAALHRKDADIAELVEKTNILRDDLEKAKREAQSRAEDERKQWKLGCDALQSAHETAHLQFRIALSNEKISSIDERYRHVQLKIGNVIRDHRLSRFQTREMELTWQITDLTNEAEAEREESTAKLEAATQEYKVFEAKTERRLQEAEQQRQQDLDDLIKARKDVEKAQTALKHLKVQHSSLEDNHQSTSLKLERLTLELASLQAQEKEWKSRASDWQSLEKRGEKEFDKLRKAKVELEDTVRDLEQQLAEKKKEEKSDGRALEKEKKKVASLSDKIERLETQLDSAREKALEAQREAAEARSESARAQAEIVRVKKQVARLQAQADAPRSAPTSNATVVDQPASPEPEVEPEPVSKPVRKVRKTAPATALVESDASEQSDADFSPAKSKPARKPSKPPAGHKRTASKLEEKPAPVNARARKVVEEGEQPQESRPTAAGRAEVPPVVETVEATDDGQKRKKRRLMGAPAAQPFQWAAATDITGAIPNILSPIKGSAPVPPRAGIRNLTLGSGRIF